MTRHGTANFRDMAAAIGYYGEHEAKGAIEEGRIQIGKPNVKPGERLLIDKEGRYHIETE